jgi:hypothetical protein
MALLTACVVALAVSACGPIEYVNQVTRKASASVAAAKAVDADKYSPYYYTLAIEYLHKAREEAAAADFQAANRFGRKADDAAVMAKKQAIDRAGQPIEKFHPNMGEGAESGGGLSPLVDPVDTAADESSADTAGDESGADTAGDESGADTAGDESGADTGVIEEPDEGTDTDDDEVPPGLGGQP